MAQIMFNFLGSFVVDSVASQLVFCSAIIITIVMIVWLLDLMIQLFKNFWR